MFFGVCVPRLYAPLGETLATMSIYDFLGFAWAMLFWGFATGLFLGAILCVPRWR